eukprot:m51a1_g2166 hypothetical protein (352) ;mRNA; r:52112-53167
MSVLASPDVVSEGDLVVLYASKQDVRCVTVERGRTLDCAYGQFAHDDLVGLPYGAKLLSRGARRGWLHALRPTPELWSLCLQHRTQILYAADVSYVVARLGLVPGAVVVESGTGSGAMSTALALAVAPHGRLYTFEFHPGRAQAAREDFARTGVAAVTTVTDRDSCAAGFLAPDKGLGAGGADAVFLDLPSPWVAVGHAHEVLRAGGAFCSFSPCIEQVQRTCLELAAGARFHSVATVEVLERPYDAKRVQMPVLDAQAAAAMPRKRGPEAEGAREQRAFVARPVMQIRGHTGYLTFAVKSVALPPAAPAAPAAEPQAAAPAEAPAAAAAAAPESSPSGGAAGEPAAPTSQ